MGDYKISFYGGSNSGISSSYGNPIFGGGVYASSISQAVNVQTANQLKAISDALNTGVKGAEVQMTFSNIAESIPNQHLEEINRLRQITGLDLTLHGPMIEPTGLGVGGERSWSEEQRERAERQIWSSVQRAQKVKSDGNIVVTLHTSGSGGEAGGLPEPESKIWTSDLTDAEKKKGGRIEGISVINERTGEFGNLPQPKEDYLLKEGKKETPHEALDRINKERWISQVNDVSISASRGSEHRDQIFRLMGLLSKKDENFAIEKLNDSSYIDNLPNEEMKVAAMDLKNDLTYSSAFTNNAYLSFKELFNQAYHSAEKDAAQGKKKEELEKLKQLRDQISPIVKAYEKDKMKVVELNEALTKGLSVLENVTPQYFRPIKEFAIEKASETFSNVAVNAYKEFGDKAPVLSLENPPAGTGINRAEDMKELIEKTRSEFARKIRKEEGLSESEAKKAAEKLIGATWDVGHINMIRKHGYGTEELKQQTKTIAPYVKNIHLSDNFGMDHTELPMGMGNVPMTEHLKILQKQYGDKLKDIKQVIEAGNWVQHFQKSPLGETLEAFGSPIYGMKMSPYWNQQHNSFAGYFGGYGLNPDVHHSMYGAGFSNLPVELGGQMAGRSRVSGNAMD